MSLHALANHLQSAGRGDDKVLIHMTPKEVKGLQAIAMAHGGSLTINPETGLPEAGFLDRMLPTIIGAGLTIASGGALSPLMAAGITGAGYGLAKGSLQEGLMAGLGAYGGAGLASGLSAAGAAGAQTAGSGASYGQWMGTDAGKLAVKQSLEGAGTGAVGAGTGAVTGAVDATTGGLQALSPGSPFAANPSFNASTYGLPGGGFASNTAIAPPVNASALVPKPASVFTTGVPNGVEGASIRQAGLDKSMANSIATQQKAGISSGTPSYWDNVKGGFKEATGSFDGLKNVWDKTPTGTGYGLLATGMGIMQDRQNKGTGAPAASDSYIRPYDYSVAQDPNAYAPNASTAERKYFVEPRFTARPIEKVAKEGGLMSINNYGIGGAVEQMSAENSVSGNTMYPQSQIQTAMYSNPMVQRPVQNDVINAGLDAPTQPYSGEQRMASGGVARYGFGGVATAIAQPNSGGGDINGTGLIAQLLRQAQQQGAFSNSAPSSYTAPTPSAAYTPQGQAAGAPDTSMVPNIQLQPLRTPDQQLGLESFYSNMNQRLADQGGYAAGGVARYNVGGSLTPASPANPLVPMASGQLYLGNPPPMASVPAVSKPTNTGPSSYTAPKPLDPYVPKGQGAGNPDMSMVPNIQFNQQPQDNDPFYQMMNQQLAQQSIYGGYAAGGMAGGGYNLGGYSDGGRLLKGPGDGVSDSIPASIGDRQPARLADGEFVVPARIVSELGNGSTEAGARKLYQMMERVQKARRKTVGKNQVAKNNKAEKLMPA